MPPNINCSKQYGFILIIEPDAYSCTESDKEMKAVVLRCSQANETRDLKCNLRTKK